MVYARAKGAACLVHMYASMGAMVLKHASRLRILHAWWPCKSGFMIVALYIQLCG